MLLDFSRSQYSCSADIDPALSIAWYPKESLIMLPQPILIASIILDAPNPLPVTRAW